jgi:hypothetical protein
MIKKLAIGAGALALTAGVAVAAPASAAPMNEGAACVQAGIGFLKENNLLQAAAQKQIDYGAVLPGVVPEGTFLSLGQVVKLHTTNPEIFPWCSM